MKILDLKDDDLFCLYQEYISDEEFESIRDNAFCMIENHDSDVLVGADYLYDDFLSWLQQREKFMKFINRNKTNDEDESSENTNE